MATDFNISPYFDDYYASNGGLDKNYYKVLFRPGRALQARELTTAQTILQNQIGTFGKHFFPKGAMIYGGEKTLHNPMPYVTLNRTLTDGSVIPTTSTGDTFTNIPNGTVVEGSLSGLKAVVQYAMPIEGDPTQVSTYNTDAGTLWIQYLSSSETSDTFFLGESLLNADGEEVAVVASFGSTYGHGVSIEDSIVFTKETFVRTDAQRIILSKYADDTSSRVGYVVVDKIAGSTADTYVDVVDDNLKDNASGYKNYSADGADRHKVELILCSLGYVDGWVENTVKFWNSNYRYHKNKKIRLSGTSEVFICVKSHTATTANKPVSGQDTDYWVQATNFIEVARTVNGQWVVPLIPQNEVGFSQPTYDALIKIIEDRHYKTHGSFTVKPFGLSIKNNNEDGIKLSDGTTTVSSNSSLLFSVESGHAFHLGHEIITQLPENFVVDRARIPGVHEGTSENYTPDINYGNYIVVDNLNGYFDTEANQVVNFYSEPTSNVTFDDAENLVATAKIRYFTLNSGRKSFASNAESAFYPDFRAYIYDIKSVAPGDMKSMASETGQADTEVTSVTISQTVDGQVNIITSNSYAKIYESGFSNKAIFQLSPGYIKTINTTNSNTNPIFYTTRIFDAKIVKNTADSKYELYNADTDTWFTESDFGEDIGKGIIDPANSLDLADANYTIYNASESSFEVNSCEAEGTVTIGPGDMVPNDLIAGETGCDFRFDVHNLKIIFPSANTDPETITDVKLAVRIGVTNIEADTKTFYPCQSVLCATKESANTQGYNSKEISLFKPDVYSIAAIYMADSNTATDVVLPTVEFTTSDTFLVGEKVKEINALTNKETGVTGFLVENTEDDVWDYLLGRGSHENTYFTQGNKLVGVTSGAEATITANTVVNDGARDITASYEFKSGQTDNFYGWSSIVLKNDKETPSAPIKVIYSAFDTEYVDGIKKYFTIDSYGSFDPNDNDFICNVVEGSVGLRYESLPMYNSPRLGTIALRDTVDFRPIRTANTISDLSEGEFSEISRTDWDPQAIKQWNPSPVAKDLFKINYAHFKSQSAIVVLNNDYDFEIITAKPGGGGYPATPEGAMLLWKVNLPPYTAYPSEIVKTYVDNRRYTMKDINHLDSRITKLEKAVKLNTEEIKALSTPVRSISDLYQGLERFKNGIFVDSFSGHGKGDVMDPNYKCSIDPDIQVCRPPFESRAIDLDVYTISNNSALYHSVNTKKYKANTEHSIVAANNNNGIITLPYTNEVFISQNDFTTAISVNPYNVSTFVGTVALDPESDNWMDTERQPSVEINLEGDADAWDALVTGVNERLEITISDPSQFAVGTQVRCADGGTGKVVGNSQDNGEYKVVLTDHEGKFSIGAIITSQEDPSFTPTILNTFTQGGATGFGTQFGDWQTTWTGTDIAKDVVATSTETRTITNVSTSTTNVTRPVTDTRRVYTPGYSSYRPGTWSVQTVTVGEVSVPLTTVNVTNTVEEGTRTVSRTTTTVSNIDTAAGIRNDLGTEVLKTELGDKVVDVSIIPYIREKMVLFDASGLKPNTKHVPYFNGIDVSEHCAPRTEMLEPNTPWSFDLFGAELVSDAKGSFKGVFRIPASTFQTGERKFRLIDVTIPANALDKAKSFCEAMYTASGIKQTVQGQVVSTRVPTINQKNLSTEKMVTSSDSTYETSICWGDPLAQTFLVDPTRIKNGAFVTSIDLFVHQKPTATELPIWIDIRSTENGYPSQVTVPGSKVMYNLEEDLHSATLSIGSGITFVTKEEHNLHVNQPITILNDENHGGVYYVTRVDNAYSFFISTSQLISTEPLAETIGISKVNIASESNGWAPTRFVFKNPIYLAKGEYAFVVQSNSDEYECYLAEMGGTSLRTGDTISQQPYAGVMFKSQNASTWSATQEADIAFVINRAKFETATPGVVTFTHNPDSMATLKGFAGDVPETLQLKYNSINIQSDVLNTVATNVDWRMKNGPTESLKTAKIRTDIELSEPKILQRDQNYLQVEATLTTSDDYVSPVIDLTDQRVILVENIINIAGNAPYEDVAKSTELFEWDNKNAYAQAKYISRSIVLDEGMDANDMRVTLLASRKRNEDSLSYIDCYIKIQASDDNNVAFIDQYWYPMTLISDPGYSVTITDFKKYEFKPVNHFWVIERYNEALDKKYLDVHYTGDAEIIDGVELTYSEADLANGHDFIGSNNVPVAHFEYDEQEETIYYTYFSGGPYLGNLEELKTGTYETFKQYAIKAVMMTNNSSMVPIIKECKAIALT